METRKEQSRNNRAGLGHAEYIMRNTELDEAQAGIKIARRNISNVRYADDITLWQEVKKN